MSLAVNAWPKGIPIDQENVANVWSEEGYDCNLWIDPPGREWINFTHAVDEKIVVQQGTIELEVAGESAMLGPGDQVVVPAGAKHSVWNRGDVTAHWFYGYRRLEEPELVT